MTIVTNLLPPSDGGHSSRWQQFQLNMDAADSTEELKLDVTAPTIASNPSNATQVGATRLSMSGNTSEGFAETLARRSAGHG
jgi:hypothetical protein